MDMTISIPDEIVMKLKERAANMGQSLPAYAAKLLSDTITKPTLDDLLEPVRNDFARAAMSEDELMDLGRESLIAVRHEKKAKSA